MAAPAPRRRKAKAFVRVSTNKQDNARQQRDVEKLARRFHLDVEIIYELDGLSGRKVRYDKKFLQALDALLADPEAEGLIVSAIDRYFRCDRYTDTELFDRLADRRKTIWSIVEGEVEPWTDEGFNTCMTAALKSGAEWRELRRRTTDGKVDKAEAGFLPHGNAWFGVDIIGRRHTGVIGEGKAVLNEREAPIVREAFAMALTMHCYEIAAEFNTRGLRSKGYNGKPGREFSRKTVHQMLTNPSAKGRHLWKGIEIPVPAIVSEELWDAVQAKLKERGEKWQGRPSKLYLLRKFLYCGRCGHRCGGVRSSGSSKHPRKAYRCKNQTNKPPIKRNCAAAQITMERADEISWGAVWGLLKQPELLLEMGRDHCLNLAAPEQGAIEEIRTAIRVLEQRDRNLSRGMDEAKDDAEYDEKSRARRGVRARLASLEADLRSKSRVMNLPPLQMVEAYTRKITSSKAEPKTYEERRPILEGIIDLRIQYFDMEQELVISGAVPVSAEATGEDGQNGRGRVHAADHSYQPIPFILRRRVA